MELNEIIKTWYRLACRGDIASAENSNVFFKFIAVWVAFNGLYASLFSEESGDQDQVVRFAGRPGVIDEHRLLIANDSDYLKAVKVLKKDGVGRGGGRRRNISTTDNLNEVLLCVYQVRCNLFHGGKAPGRERDELLVEASYTIVSKLVAPFVRLEPPQQEPVAKEKPS